MPPSSALSIRAIEQNDHVNAFSTGNAEHLPLKNFLRNQAIEFHFSNIVKTYVAVDDQNRVWGYTSLMCSDIELEDGYELEDCDGANCYETLPAVKIARLAVDSKLRGKGLGRNLIEFSIAIAKDMIMPHAGCRFLVVDAKQDAVSFYRDKIGFTLLDTEGNENTEHPVMFIDLQKNTV